MFFGCRGADRMGSGMLQVVVKGLCAGTFVVTTTEEESVLQLKERIAEIEGVPGQLLLKCSNRYLQDYWTLGQCSLAPSSVVSVGLSCQGGVQITVKSMGKGPTFDLDVELSDTIEQLKSKIEELQGIPSADLRLAFRGKTLADEEALSSIKQLESKGSATFLMTQKKGKPVAKATKAPEPATPAELCLNNCGFYG